jgi:hypothetical protein
MDPYTPTEPMPAEPVRYDQYGRPLRPVEPVQPVQPVEPVEPVRYAEPVAPVEDVGRAWSVYRASQIVYLVLGVLESLIAIRLVLRLLGANPEAGFTSLIYGVTAPFVAPFTGVFPNPAGFGSVLELSSVLALVVYPLLAWAIVRLIHLIAERRPPAAV